MGSKAFAMTLDAGVRSPRLLTAGVGVHVRAGCASILGPSLETPYLRSTGRDLIYVLGPQRDSYFAIASD